MLYVDTGLKPGSATKSNIFVNVTGDDGKSGARQLLSQEQNVGAFSSDRAGVNTVCFFVLARASILVWWH